MAGVKSFVLQPEEGDLPDPEQVEGGVSALDHVVVSTPNPDRLMATYGAKLGLDLRMDRTFPDWGARLLFFRVGDLILEVMHRLDGGEDPGGSDAIWGLSWRVDDLPAAQARLRKAGLDVSDIRKGRKPGTQVLTVKSGTLGIPTLFIAKTDD